MASKREAVTVFGVGQHVVAAEEEETDVTESKKIL